MDERNYYKCKCSPVAVISVTVTSTITSCDDTSVIVIVTDNVSSSSTRYFDWSSDITIGASIKVHT